MKQLFLLLFIISCLTANAKTYYISSGSGNDANSGLSTTTAWKTITKLNASFSTLLPGDAVLFNRGETFYGSIIVSKSGSSGNPIVFGAYGTGANPIITGFTTVSSWTNLGNNIWESTNAVSALNDMNCVVINNVNTAMGRFPNTGYFTTESHVGQTSITSSSLSGAADWTGADVVMKTWNFAIARNLITSQSGSTLNYNATTTDNGHDGYGFFIENNASTLDVQNEWYYTPSTKKIRIYSTSSPTNVQVSTADTLVYMTTKNYLTFDGIDFTGSNRRAFYIGSCANITIQNCNFNYHGLYAIWGGNNHGAASSNFNFNHNTVNHVNSQGIVLQSEFVNPYIGYNTFNNCGVMPGMFKPATTGGQWDGAFGSIYVVKTNGLVVEYNSIDSTGYTGIHFTGDNTRINNNEVSKHCLLLMDGGGIYTWTGVAGTPTIGSKIYNNIVHDGFGNNSGTTEVNPLCQGLYLDENTRNTEVYNNTFFNNPYGGIFSNANTNCNIHNNTCYNNTINQILFSNNYNSAMESERLNIVKNNIFFSKAATQYAAKFSTKTNDIDQFFSICDSNYYCRPIDENKICYTNINNAAWGYYSLPQWQAFINIHDSHSKKAPKTITNVNDLRIEYNATSVNKTVSLNGNYTDVKNVSYNGTITLAPYTSAVLILNGAATNQSPVAAAGNDQTITLPTSTVSLSGSGTDSDGTISSYSWTKISGPASGTITSATSASTTVTTLIQGVYQFQLQVTDNNAATDIDIVQITVNAANLPPTANAGSDQSITLPTSTASISGSGTDSDGTISSYSWTKISGPTSGTITSATSASTTVTTLIQGVYQFQLQVTDNNAATDIDIVQITVNAANLPPTANAGSDQSITLPTSTASISGSGTDSDGTISSYSWTKISGPTSGTITSPTSASTTVTALTQGVYQFQLQVTDNDGATGLNTILITVNAANLPPTANAGSDQSITLPTSTASISGSGTDSDGTISSYSWTKISGPSSGTITSANSASTTVTALTQGVYQFQLQVTDNDGATGLNTILITVNAANLPPTANAGTDQSITLPVSTATVSGSGTDTDGTISSYNWTKISGPTSGTITSANSASTTVTGLTQGVYQFQLKVTDNDGATGLNTILITVNAANLPPTANAGTSQVIKLPINSVSLIGTGTDTDGTISSYSWTKTSGPASGTITSANSTSTTVTGLTQGIYLFQLQVTDNDAATAVATVQITVNAANILPTANAGTSQVIKLPINSVSLIGTGTDTDGTISSYSWTKTSGPVSGTITTASSASTTVTGLTQGVYIFQLQVTDNNAGTSVSTVQITVNAANILPTATAGTNQVIKLPVNSVSLSGTGTDTDGTISSYSWTKTSGPVSGTITTASSASTTVTGLTQGVYLFQLQVTDNDAATAIATVQITVNAANILPTANAGTNQVIKLPVNSVSLSGTGNDSDGTISSYSWTKTSGPASGTITTASSASTTVTGLTQGVYIFQLQVTDNNAGTAVSTVQITVNAANILPTANAGTSQVIKLPINSVSLIGTGTDTDGTISSYSWTKTSGPASGTITTANTASTTVTGLTQGVYIFQLQVTDNDAATAVANVQITVNAANILPTATAGTNQVIKLPINSVSLSGTGTDTDGTISSYSWTKTSGPASGTITTANTASTTVTGLTQGVYLFQLQVTDNDAAIAVATVQITVNAANILPTANAGTNQVIKLPINSVSLSGTGTDTDGTISSYSWTKTSGPASGTITTANMASTTITGLTQGVYIFQLQVTDNDAATAVATVQITVNAANILPTATAGTSQVIKLPVNSVSLNGTGTDTDGTISSYSWTKTSGPATGTITTANTASTTVTGLTQGVYIFQLQVTDNNAGTAVSTVQITVNAANVLPTANAGTNQVIKLPVNSVSLSGTGNDSDGTISSYSWTKTSGPASGTITTASSASTTVTGLTQGVYIFQLQVTDNNAGTAVSTVQITVNAANVLPTANAGTNQVIKLPVNSVSLSGTGNDSDGTISSYSWTKTSGPVSGTITTASSASTTVTGLTQGVYIFQLQVTDNDAATAIATVQITVNAANVLPIANAGTNQVIKLPVNSVSLSGTGTDTDGTISSYSWTKTSGPATGTITSANSASTTITGLTQGVYIFQLQVTDNNAGTAVATVQITVNAANILPTATAGTNQVIKLPINSVSLIGTGTDTDGTISSYSWTKTSGPASGTITTASSASTTVTGLTQGVYIFQLQVTDNDAGTAVSTVQITVNAANILPTANAGTSQVIKLPINSVSLSGTGTDTDGTISSYSWTKTSGPASGTITTANTASTTVTGLTQGVYIFQLQVTDNNAGTAIATVQITVNAANILPTANAGTNQVIKLPVNSVSLSGTGTDTDGTISSYSWTKTSGPVSGTITTASSASTTVTGLTQGVYIFQLQVTDNDAATAVSTVQITVNAANILPTTTAGTNQVIKLPVNSVSLSGTGTDTDGTISSYSWTKTSGPATGTITTANTASTTITGLTQGVYIFQLQVTDNDAATAVSTVQITVNAANILPTANAGTSQVIKLPINSVSLIGTGTDTDGTISSYSWTKTSGPATGTITTANTASTTITGLTQGVYIFQLQVTDNNAATAVATVQITVNAANILPTATAGTNQVIKLPINSVSLIGTGTDTDGTISSYSWTKTSGPASGTITTANTASTTVTGLTQGVYIFQLQVTDNDAATAVATVQITVNAANILPTANAGTSQVIKLPINSVSLSGMGTDTDGTISSYSWTKTSGPASGTITTANMASTTVTGLTQGVYIFQLQVTDNDAATAVATVQITVNAANILPTATAGTSQVIKLPINSVSLSGSGTDTDGTISSYSWTKTSGPATGTITTANTASTTVTGLTQGVYLFQLQVTDNDAATAVANVQITVNAANILPTATAGTNQVIKLPINSVSLIGTGTDTDGTISSYSWTKTSGPATGTITSANTASTTVTGLTQGVYIFQLQVTDNDAATAVATVQITVNAANILPTATAGTSQVIKLPINSVSLSGSGTDTDGTISSYSWTKTSGPATGTITTANTASTTVTGLTQGVYLFQLQVTDNDAATAVANVQITVNAANILPTATAGTNQVIKLPINSVSLIGTGTDTDGTISSYSWTKTSGPATGTITSANTASTTVTGLTQGVYIFQLQVTDNDAATAVATVQITVNAANILPTATAGTSQVIKLPINSVSLSGSGTDTDGTISSYSWTKTSGPASGTITTANTASTTVTGLTQGVYLFQLQVTDNDAATAVANVQITVNAANILPTATAGTNQVIKLPINSVSLSGTGTDTDGTISSYSWTKTSGPATGTITTANTASTTITALTQGVYIFQLQVTDNNAATAVATVQITVNAANILPTATAGTSQVIKLPINSVSLIGTGTDTDGTISSYSWTKTSGPATGTITTGNTASTTITGLTQGVYIFQLQVTDNDAATAIATVQITVNAANILPTATAGTNQVIKLPINSVSLIGTGTDTDGTISSYSWTKTSGPASGTITSANTASTTVTGLTQGVYIFQLQVTDNNAGTAIATVQITVNAANILPTATAGTNQVIKLPINSVSLSGTGTDTDGTISSYSWTKTSGPVSGTITTASSASTTVTGLTQGVYIFQLQVTDNDAATAIATVQITVNAANVLPTANAGTNQVIKLPVNSVSLSGTGTDTDGTISSYSWTKTSGPASGTITSANSASTTVTGLTQGVYIFQLQVTDNDAAIAVATVQITVNAANVPPTANAGADQSIKLPINSVSLSGTGTDTDGTISKYSWTKTSGPATGTITTANSASTTVTALTQGVYLFQLKVTDNDAATAVDTIQVTVTAAANVPPTANAGTDQSITLPISSVSLSGSGADTDGSISAFSWTQVSGPASGAITTVNTASTTVTALTQGVYQFELKVTDNNAATAVDTIQVTVTAAANVPPTANAGTDQSITLPINSVSLGGSGADTDGSISAFSWTQVSGPASGAITTASSASTTVTALTQGVYQFELKVTDNNAATAVDTIQVTVTAAANVLPTANAGTDQSITLPINSVSLSGSGADTDGSISSFSWTQVSGPASGAITTASSASTTVTALTQGVYQFELKVTDDKAATAVDTIQVTVTAAANVLPTANAGADQSITLPINSVSLSGSGADTDGSISAFSWTQVSGPASGAITTASSASTTVTALTQGVYQFELKVTDNNAATAVDTIQVTVTAAANVLPTANAGTDQSITLPINSVSLSGSGADTDGSISSFSWTQVSGPASGAITTASSASTTVTALTQGVYQFELKVTDNNAATAVDTIQVTVTAAANVLPTANAGADQSITLPINSVSLSGSGADTDGSISAFSWTQVSGPASGAITTANTASTTVTALTQGVYQFELKVTDNNAATAVDTIQVTVTAAANVPPTANAGTDQSITLPISSVSLSGSGADTDGSISAFSWTQVSGPASGAITTVNTASTTVTALTQGVYQFELKVTDNNAATAVDTIQVTVTAAANVPPTANAGTDQSITLPINSVSLGGSGADTDGSISAFSWTQVSGPASGAITTASSASTTVTALTQGVYQFELKVTDNNAATAVDTIQVTVTAAANALPTANAGTDQSITLPINSVSLSGSGADTDGSISAFSWTQVSGPASGAITTASSASTTVTALTQGVYQFELKVTDNNAATAVDTIQVTVTAAANVLPTANAGTDQSITLPINSVSLSGSGADTDGSISAFSWTQVSGPASGAITTANSASTTVTALTQGVYQFELKVTDNNAATAVDTIQVTVTAANILPIAKAGKDQTMILPTNTVNLSGSGTAAGGSITAYNWTKISGPVSGTITNAASASTTVTTLVQGVYRFKLKVTDNKAETAVDTVQMTVIAANTLPTANAGADQSITLPINSVLLTGKGTDPDGIISAYRWTKLSGPLSFTITNFTLASTQVTALVKGVYRFQLRVTDNKAATAFDTVQITVNAANIPPIAKAGKDQIITLPTSTVSLSGIGTDIDGSISAYRWTKISGPVSCTISNFTRASTTVTALVQGVYKFQLRVTDNKAATAFDTVQITVAAVNIPPTANAGPDQSITLPLSMILLNGKGTDPDGSISGYKWTKISGPISGIIINSNSAATFVASLVQGVYRFQLKVTDNRSATVIDTIQVTVNAANIPPTAAAGKDQVIIVPTSTVSLSGSGTDTDGIISTYKWTKISGPTSGTITTDNSALTTVTALAQGIYRFQLKVTDNKAATAADTVQIIVNIPPTANAGVDQTITLPVSTATLSGSAIDQDGTIVNYNWTKISGPTSSNIVNLFSPVTDVYGLVQGVYQFELKVTDNNGTTGSDTVKIIVDAAGNIVPTIGLNINKVEINKYVVYQNFPNPFTNTTTIRYEVKDKAPVKIMVFNSVNTQVAVLVNGIKQPGSYQIQWNATNLPAGSYYYTVIIGDNITTKMMLKIN